jgi:CheY-like chemotaxis protein
LKILIVDDEPVIADTLVDILNGEGYDAISVSNGQSAVRWAQLIRPDVIVSDVVMPGMNGIEAAKSIKLSCPECRIILFSGHAASEELLRQAHEDGYDFEVLTKPVNPIVLLATLGPSVPKQKAAVASS